jgi:hypothetical protein
MKHLAFFSKIGIYEECQVDKSGHWLMSLEDLDGRYGPDMRVFDLANESEIARIYSQDGAVSRADMGFGYVVGASGAAELPNATVLWYFGSTVTKGPVVHCNVNWNLSALHHLSHANAKADLPPGSQFACGSDADRISGVQNEITCVRLDGSAEQLIVAPVLTNLDAPGGQVEYRKAPHGHLDVTGQYFIWTTNLSGARLDALLVKVPSQRLFK